ncbi:DUF2867 domain-containing protein [Roseobacter sp. SK209-2-6]|uniref:DUF2867 domain-containing protein n=1 Tax=Roseobacter sp. SK209-2-6 TaxID=388739 RepID=UPI0002F33CB0|nr:DUF2867 domain-containing protein [Roseobacter sp. SK209-2-6]
MPQIQTTPLPRNSHLWSQVQPGDFIDGYAVNSGLDPEQAAKVGLSMPGWARALLSLRNRIVRPLGLKTDVADAGQNAIFPVTYQDESEIILGADDNHLDFRICIRQQDGMIHMATWVHRNNLLGRIYLAVVMPFHILIVRDAMGRIRNAS